MTLKDGRPSTGAFSIVGELVVVGVVVVVIKSVL